MAGQIGSIVRERCLSAIISGHQPRRGLGGLPVTNAVGLGPIAGIPFIKRSYYLKCATIIYRR
jgi:hypothetical protein